MKDQVVLDETEEGFAASVPALPGCHSQRETEPEALEKIAEAIREHLEAIRDRCDRAWFKFRGFEGVLRTTGSGV